MPATADAERPWHEIVLATLKANKVQLVTYVPDNVLKPLIDAIHKDPFFTAFCVTREEEGLGIVTGAWMGGMRGVLMMQTSGFATLPNAIASLAVDAAGKLLGTPRLSAPGLFEPEDPEAARIAGELANALADLPQGLRRDDTALVEAAKTALRKSLGRRLQKRPLVDIHLLRV